MIKYTYIVFFALCFVACNNKEKENIPTGILSKEKMVAVITDLHIAEAAINLNLLTADSLYNIYEKNKITKAQYDSSFKYYTMNPDLLLKIYDEVLNEISKKQAEVVNYKGAVPLKHNVDTIPKKTLPEKLRRVIKKRH